MSARIVLMCDRCGDEAVRDSARGWSAHLVSLSPATVKGVDLCPSCSREFSAWLLTERTNGAHVAHASGAV